jgi:hypothetical protein
MQMLTLVPDLLHLSNLNSNIGPSASDALGTTCAAYETNNSNYMCVSVCEVAVLGSLSPCNATLACNLL